jgi:UPF0271 protein
VDLNADLGEEHDGRRTDDAGLVGVVTSANVACGFHSGDPATMRRVSELCVAGGVAIGAQVSYRDRDGFGRRFLDVDPAVLAADVLEQVATLDALARSVGGRVTYVKPHGALYNAVVDHDEQAAALVEGVVAFGGALAVVGLPRSPGLVRAEAAGLRPVREAFADRAYAVDGTLVPRGEPGAVVSDPDDVVARALRLATDGTVVAQDGTVVRVDPESICLHGDTPGAVALARSVRAALIGAGVAIERFAPR